MRKTRTILLAGGLALVVACAPAGDAAKEGAAKEEAAATDDAAIEAPAEPPKVAANDPLTSVTCADFLDTAKVASVQPADDAALAAQDELVNGLTWLHGYTYAKTDGKVEPLTQEWMATTAKSVFDACSKVEKPAETSLSELAAS
jgi:hypothetical protein